MEKNWKKNYFYFFKTAVRKPGNLNRKPHKPYSPAKRIESIFPEIIYGHPSIKFQEPIMV